MKWMDIAFFLIYCKISKRNSAQIQLVTLRGFAPPTKLREVLQTFEDW